MAKRAGRNHTPAFKAKVAFAAKKGDKTLAELVQLFEVYPDQLGRWRSQLLEGAAGVFGAEKGEAKTASSIDMKRLRAESAD